jgi:hypothetical protein
LLHLDSEAEPGVGIDNRRSGRRSRNPSVETSAELDHYGSRVGTPGVFNEVEELVQVFTNRSFALIVGRCLQHVDSDGFKMEG